MEIRVLKYFLAVAHEESISKAAERLHITQPTLSRQLMDLEKELKTRLLIRGKRNKKVTLTDDGKLLKSRAQEIVDLANKTEAEFVFDDKNITGDIFIGGGETDAMRVVAKVINKMSVNYPSIKYHLYSGNGEDVKEKLNKGLLDFGLFIEPVDKKEYEFINLSQKDVWGILMKKNSPLSKKECIEPQDLKDLPIFNKTSKWLDIYFSGNKPDFTPEYKIENLTPFRKEVIDIMNSIPFGKTLTYNDISKVIAKKRGIEKMSSQAVGGAVRMESNLYYYSLS